MLKPRPFVQVATVILFLILLLALPACRNKGGSSGHYVNGEGFAGLTYDDGRSRCRYKEKTETDFDVLCQAVNVTPDGEERIATSVSPGLEVKWSEGLKVEGGEIVSQVCSVAQSRLSQICSVQLRAPVPTVIRYAMTLSIATDSRSEFDTVRLPLSAITIGNVPQLLSYSLPSSATTQDAVSGNAPQASEPFGYSVPELSTAESTNLGQIRSLCSAGPRIFLVANTYIYQMRDGALSLFAGSTNRANVNELSHRLRVAFGTDDYVADLGVRIACGEDGIFVWDSGNERILHLRESGPVRLIAKHPLLRPQAASAGQMQWSGGVLFIADGNRYVLKVDIQNSSVEVAAGKAADGSLSEGISATEAALGSPGDVAVSANGTVLVADTDNCRVRRLERDGTIHTVVGNLCASSPLGKVAAIERGRGQELWIADQTNSKVYAFYPSGLVDKTPPGGNLQSPYLLNQLKGGELLVATGSLEKSELKIVSSEGQLRDLLRYSAETARPLEEPSDVVSFRHLQSIALDPQNSLFLADAKDYRVRKIEGDFSKVRTVAGNGKRIFTPPAAPLPTENALGTPISVSILPNGTVIVLRLEARNQLVVISGDTWRIQPLTPPSVELHQILYDPTRNTLLGRSGGALAQISLLGQISFITTPNADCMDPTTPLGSCLDLGQMAVASDGAVYFAQPTKNRILKVADLKVGTPFEVIAGTGEKGFAGDGGPATQARFSEPWGIAIGPKGELFVADSGNGRVRLLTPRDENGSAYTVSTYVGGAWNRDCSGKIADKLPGQNYDELFKVSIPALCIARPYHLLSHFTCDSAGNGEVSLIFSQMFGAWVQASNLIKIDRPCPKY